MKKIILLSVILFSSSYLFAKGVVKQHTIVIDTMTQTTQEYLILEYSQLNKEPDTTSNMVLVCNSIRISDGNITLIYDDNKQLEELDKVKTVTVIIKGKTHKFKRIK